MIIAQDTRKLRVTGCPTYSDVVERFNKGLHKRIRDVVRPDQAISHDLVKAIVKMVNREWEELPPEECLGLALEGAFYTLAFTLALWGKEVPLIEIGGIRKHWVQGQQHPTPNVVVTLLGRFKNEMGECYHWMPVLSVTPRGLQPGLWVERVLHAYSDWNVHSGYMFHNVNGTRGKIKSLEEPHLLNPEVDVSEEYRVSRSFCRGGTSESQIMVPHPKL